MIAKRTVFVLGNSIEKSDGYAVKLIPLLKKKFPDVGFVHFDPTEELHPDYGDNLIIIDTVEGIKEVRIFNDLNHFARSPANSVHDYDLPLSLGILKKLGKIKKVTIIGVPPRGKEKNIIKEIKKLLSPLL